MAQNGCIAHARKGRKHVFDGFRINLVASEVQPRFLDDP